MADLRAHDKLVTLLKLDAGDLTKEANAMALLCALDRVEMSRGLPKHLKLYAAGDAFQVVYAVQLGSDLWVVHAFQKKSTQGIKTPKHEIDLINERLKRLKEALR